MPGSEFALDEIFYPSFGRSGWQQNSADLDLVAMKDHRELGTLLWVNHPRTLRCAGTEKEVLSFVVGYVAAVVRRDSWIV